MAARSFARRGMRRKVQWVGMLDQAGANAFPVFTALPTATAAILSFGVVASGIAADAVEEEVTITRTIGLLTVHLDVDTADALGAFAVGLIVQRGEQVTAGVASMPTPLGDPDAEWLYWTAGMLRNSNLTSREGPISSLHIPFDIRSQRVLRRGSTPVWLGQGAAAGLVASVSGRYLVKLP